MIKEVLIIFVKNPVKGKVKTRLARSVGEQKALTIYEHLLNHTHNITKDISCDKLLFYSDFIPSAGDQWDGVIYKKQLQSGNDLGSRMQNAFSTAFSQGASSTIIIGSDCLELNLELIEEAFSKLQQYDFVIGPALDGGYYLLGMKHLPLIPSLKEGIKGRSIFQNKKWSTSTVFEDTINDIKQLNATYFELPVLSDIDEAKDLERLNVNR